MIPSIGRIVHYKLNDSDVTEINRRRADARRTSLHFSGAIIHTGNQAEPGMVFPMLITRVWGLGPNGAQITEESVVQGQVFLDGNDTLWVTSRHQGDSEGQWSEPPRV